ncbi:MAG: integrase family protein [Vicinamibacterales bacterium]
MSKRINFTATRVAEFQCPTGKPQAFLWDAKAPGLALRVTAHGARSYVFQSRLKEGGALRMTIGEPASWSIPDAQAEARKLQGLIDQGKDPRIERAATIAGQQAERQAAKVERAKREVSGLDAWTVYVAARQPHWGERNHADHLAAVAEGGAPRKRSRVKLTIPGILRDLLARPLAEVNAEAVEKWIKRETRDRPTKTALAFRQLRAFVNWCAEHPDYRGIVVADACRGKRVREKLAKPAAKDDALQREQLTAWFAEVRKLSPVMSGYLQVLLLTGCRPGEALGLQWADVDFKWKSVRIRDKVEGERTIPLTPYVAELLAGLKAASERPPKVPRRIGRDPEAAAAFKAEWKPSVWVFGTRHAAGGRIADGREPHGRVLAAAGLPHVTLHGLRRSFGTLSEWVEAPVGIVAQIQGHKPSAIAEKHYRVRPLDLLRMWHTRIEGWILTEAGIEQPKAQEPGARPALKSVAGVAV